LASGFPLQGARVSPFRGPGSPPSGGKGVSPFRGARGFPLQEPEEYFSLVAPNSLKGDYPNSPKGDF